MDKKRREPILSAKTKNKQPRLNETWIAASNSPNLTNSKIERLPSAVTNHTGKSGMSKMIDTFDIDSKPAAEILAV